MSRRVRAGAVFRQMEYLGLYVFRFYWLDQIGKYITRFSTIASRPEFLRQHRGQTDVPILKNNFKPDQVCNFFQVSSCKKSKLLLILYKITPVSFQVGFVLKANFLGPNLRR
jgi:hypothetical protein